MRNSICNTSFLTYKVSNTIVNAIVSYLLIPNNTKYLQPWTKYLRKTLVFM